MDIYTDLKLDDFTSDHYGQKIGLIAIFASTMIMNSLSNAGKFGKNNATVSAQYPTLITPPGYAFAIWGLIYSLLGSFVIFQVLPDKYLSIPVLMYNMGWSGLWTWLVLGFILSSMWLIAFSRDTNASIILQVVIIFAYLFTLIVNLILRNLIYSLNIMQEN